MVEKFFDKDPEDVFERFKNLTFSREQGRRKISWFCRNLQEFGQQGIQRIDSSYSRLPAEFLMPICTGKDDLGELVLNDTLVSIPHGSEHFSYKSKNTHEEEIYKIEDQRYFYD